ncbi:MAG: hypothetical protein AAF943_11495 [Pseudomonadota bacterium]
MTDGHAQQNARRFEAARNSFHGKTMTETQLRDTWGIAGIMERSIRRTGTFKDKLNDFTNAFARSERFEHMKGEEIIRDIFKVRFGQTMNQMREGLMEREAALGPDAKQEALERARLVLADIQQGETMPFYAASEKHALPFAKTHGVTEVAAKKSMSAAFKEAEGRDLYDVGKELEAKHHVPVREAHREAQKAERREYARSGPCR